MGCRHAVRGAGTAAGCFEEPSCMEPGAFCVHTAQPPNCCAFLMLVLRLPSCMEPGAFYVHTAPFVYIRRSPLHALHEPCACLVKDLAHVCLGLPKPHGQQLGSLDRNKVGLQGVGCGGGGWSEQVGMGVAVVHERHRGECRRHRPVCCHDAALQHAHQPAPGTRWQSPLPAESCRSLRAEGREGSRYYEAALVA